MNSITVTIEKMADAGVVAAALKHNLATIASTSTHLEERNRALQASRETSNAATHKNRRQRTDGNPLTITKIERALHKEHQGRAWVDGVYGFVNAKDSETANSAHEKVIKKSETLRGDLFTLPIGRRRRKQRGDV